MNQPFKSLIIVFASALMVACVPLKQFQDMESQKKATEEELQQMTLNHEECQSRATECQGNLKRAKTRIDQLVADTVRLSGNVMDEQRRIRELEEAGRLLNQQLRQQNEDQTSRLMGDLQKLQSDLNKREDALRKAEKEGSLKKAELLTAIAELERAKAAMMAQNQRLVQLESTLSRKDSAMNALRQSIAGALTGFSSDELNVHIKNGKVYVSMEEKLLFASGSYEVNSQGVNALQKLAVALESKSDIQIVVEGHTDDVPYRSGVLIDNWDLSVKRATAVARIIMQNKKIAPSRVMAAGRAHSQPAIAGSTPAARQKNRRTEIILTPDMDKLFDLIGQ